MSTPPALDEVITLIHSKTSDDALKELKDEYVASNLLYLCNASNLCINPYAHFLCINRHVLFLAKSREET